MEMFVRQMAHIINFNLLRFQYAFVFLVFLLSVTAGELFSSSKYSLISDINLHLAILTFLRTGVSRGTLTCLTVQPYTQKAVKTTNCQ